MILVLGLMLLFSRHHQLSVVAKVHRLAALVMRHACVQLYMPIHRKLLLFTMARLLPMTEHYYV